MLNTIQWVGFTGPFPNPVVPLPEIRNVTAIDVFDIGRVLMLVGAAVLIGYIVGVLHVFRRGDMSRWQQARFLSLMLAAVSVTGTEIGRLHDVITWRYPVNALVLAFGVYGCWGLRNGRDRIPTVNESKDDE